MAKNKKELADLAARLFKNIDVGAYKVLFDTPEEIEDMLNEVRKVLGED